MHYPPLIPNLDEEVDLVSDEGMVAEDGRIPILLITQFGFHTNRETDKEVIQTIIETVGKVGLLYRAYLSRRQGRRLLIAETSDLRDVSPESLFLFTTGYCTEGINGLMTINHEKFPRFIAINE